jgi:hypothetical protein
MKLNMSVIDFLMAIFLWLYSRIGSRPLRFWGFEITLRHTAMGSTPLDE